MPDEKPPGSDLSPTYRKWCELVAVHGWRYAEATNECFPDLSNKWNKTWRMRRHPQVKVYLAHCEAEAMKEPRRLLKVFLESTGQIAKVPNHKNFVGTMQIVSRLSGMEKDEPKDVSVQINVKTYDPEDDGS